MECQVHVWPFTLLLCLLGLLRSDLGQAQRMVTIQDGPLYRVKGFKVSISCTVSGFKGSDVQDFAFSAYRANRADMEIQIIKTDDPSFSYAVFSQRVRNGEISIERKSGSSVIFHINKALLEDTAEIECHTPNTDGTYYGTYSAKTSLYVVEDTLSVTYSGPPSMSLFEGDPLQLECQASSQTFQHTHLSVTWLVQGNGETEPRPIISLDRDLTVRPGDGYDERYKSRKIVIEKVEETRYQLRMVKLQQGDQGKIFCRVQEWIRDPDRTWVNIANRDAQAVDVTVKPVEVTADSFAVQIDITKTNLQEGEPVEVRCSVQSQKLAELFFTVAWFKGEQELARVGPLGRLTVASSFTVREREGELRVSKTTEKDYLLTLRPVRSEDQGQYQCRAWLEERDASGAFTQKQSERSGTQQVTITPKASGLSVSMAPSLSVTEGAHLTLYCNVSGKHGDLSVTWRHKTDSQGSSFSEVISQTREGMMELGPQFRQRAVLRTFRTADDVVVLEMGEAGVADTGIYECTVSEWSEDGKKTASPSQQCTVQVTPLDALVTVSLKSRTSNVVVNKEIKLLCIVKGPKVPVSVAWLFQREGSSSSENVVSLQHTGDVVWGRERRGYQLSTTVDALQSHFELVVTNASLQNNGIYGCKVEAYLRQTQRASKSSNNLRVQVQKPASLLSLSPSPMVKSTVNSDIQLSCVVAKATSISSRFNVSWQLADRIVAGSDHNGVLTLLDPSKRLSMSMLPGPMFQLALRQTGASDSGSYTCQVQEWLQDPEGEWYSLSPTNATVDVVISEKPSDFRTNEKDTTKEGPEGGQVELTCSIISGVDDLSSHLSLTWYYQSSSSHTHTLLTYSQTGDLTYGDVPAHLQTRIQFSKPNPKTFLLTVAKLEPGDSGQYWCDVEQYQHSCKGAWEKKASRKAGVTRLRVNPIAANLRLQKSSRQERITKPQEGFKVECLVQSRSSDRSAFEVIWTRTQSNGITQIVFNASRDGTFRALDTPAGGLLLKRPSTTHFTLSYLSAGPSEVGIYSCSVTEWLQMPGDRWRKLAEDQSGQLDINIQTEVTSKFSMNKTARANEVSEGQRLDLKCSVEFDPSSSSFYAVSWLFQKQGANTSVQLLQRNYDGRLRVLEAYQDRLRFKNPSKQTFGLTILNAVTSDSGTYSCRVDVYQHDCPNEWKHIVSDPSGPITVSVRKMEGNLRVKKEDHKLNVTDLHAGFKVDCNIVSQSSEESLFEVTWFRSNAGDQKESIFTMAKDGTLETMDRKGLVFGRPKVTDFTLTVPDVEATDSGQYTCTVVEWVRSVTNTWEQMATDSSGVWNVHVHIAAEAVQSPDVTIPVFVVIILILVGAIVLLSLKLRKMSGAQKEREKSLWVESNPLKPTSEA